MRTNFILSILLFFNCFALLPAQTAFTDVSVSAGIDKLIISGRKMGSGAAFFDFNNDGWEDLYLVGGVNRDMLYQNNTDGTFSEVAVSAGLSITSTRNTFGVVTGDIDNDGYRDIVVATDTSYGTLLFHNMGDGTFTEIGTSAGLIEDFWGYAPAFGDFNHDGFLDIYMGNYIEVGRAMIDTATGIAIGYNHDCAENHLYLNNGNLTFTELGLASAVSDTGCALANSFTDYDNDGDVDILVANDFGQWVVPNVLYRNEFPAVSTCTDVSTVSGVDDGMYSMGLGIGDFDHDLDLDYYITNIGKNVLLCNNNDGTFSDLTDISGVANEFVGLPADSIMTTGWGTAFMDIDNDTWQDLFVVNGWMGMPFLTSALADPDKVYKNNGDGTFADISAASGIGNTAISRGFAYSDYDNDGDLDCIVVATHWDTSSTDRVQLYRNDYSSSNHWLGINLIGVTCNRDGFGSHIRIVLPTDSWIHEVTGGSSHASQNTSIAHFGLGAYTMVDSIIVTWPGGMEQVITGVSGDQVIDITESIITEVEQPQVKPEVDFSIAPNPFSESSMLSFQLIENKFVSLSIFNTLGQEVRTLISEELPTGKYIMKWDGTNSSNERVESGMYITRLTVGEDVYTGRMLLLDR